MKPRPRASAAGRSCAAPAPVAPALAGFTLIEVMISLAIVATALVALLGLHHQNLRGVISSQERTRAAMLAQALITEAELERYPVLGQTSGDFRQLYPGQYPNFRWERAVQPTAVFPDVRKVTVRVLYGPRFRERFDLIEYLHNPLPPTPTGQ